jgi:site-specific recombinase XerD
MQTRVWKFCRMTGWRVIKNVMSEAGIFGPKACPRGLRHSFGVGTLQSGVPLHLIQRWMGHARMTTTSIYLNVSGSEEAELARLFWEFGQPVTAKSDRRALGDLEKAPP